VTVAVPVPVTVAVTVLVTVPVLVLVLVAVPVPVTVAVPVPVTVAVTVLVTVPVTVTVPVPVPVTVAVPVTGEDKMENITKYDLAVAGLDRREMARLLKTPYQTLSGKMSGFNPWKDADLERAKAIIQKRREALDRANGKQEAAGNKRGGKKRLDL
jgi:hypothetical protein